MGCACDTLAIDFSRKILYTTLIFIYKNLNITFKHTCSWQYKNATASSITRKENMKTYKIHFTSDVYETVEVEAKNTNDAKEKFHKGEIDLSEAEEMGKENLKVDVVEEVK